MFENSMVELEQTIKNVYFLGIGGIGMSALARYFKAKGYKVAGYDRTLSALTQKMQAEEETGLIISMKRKRFRLNSGIKRRRWWYILRRYPGITGNGLIS